MLDGDCTPMHVFTTKFSKYSNKIGTKLLNVLVIKRFVMVDILMCLSIEILHLAFRIILSAYDIDMLNIIQSVRDGEIIFENTNDCDKYTYASTIKKIDSYSMKTKNCLLFLASLFRNLLWVNDSNRGEDQFYIANEEKVIDPYTETDIIPNTV